MYNETIQSQLINSDFSYELLECWPETPLDKRIILINSWIDSSKSMYLSSTEENVNNEDSISFDEFLTSSIDCAIDRILNEHNFEHSDENLAYKIRLYARFEQICLFIKDNDLLSISFEISPNYYNNECDPNTVWGQHGAHFPD